jgi:homoserine O-acetyltransferase
MNKHAESRSVWIWLSKTTWIAAMALLTAACASTERVVPDPQPMAFPAPKEGDWVAKNFRFHTGVTLPEVKLHYTTVGNPGGEPVLILHGTTGSGRGMLNKNFAGELFGPGQPLDARRYFIIIPDALGNGRSSKPSDGLRMKFPPFNYADQVDAHYRLLTEHFGIKRLRVIIGNSMGGMHAWVWAQRYPDAMDIAVPIASQPVAMSSRNWMMRRFIIESIRNDPDWNNGNYSEQPRAAQFASVFYAIGTNGGDQRLYRLAPTREQADKIVEQRLKAPFHADANDTIYRWNASRDYDPEPGLAKIKAVVLAINSADDERNPPETGAMDRAIRKVRNGRVLLIPASDQTFGHGTAGHARFWKKELAALLDSTPRGK